MINFANVMGWSWMLLSMREAVNMTAQNHPTFYVREPPTLQFADDFRKKCGSFGAPFLVS